MHHSATPGHAPGCRGRRYLSHYPANGAAVDGHLVAGRKAKQMKRYPLPYIRRRRLQPTEAETAYARTVAMLARCDGLRSLTGPVAVTVAVYRERKSGDLLDYLLAVRAAAAGVLYDSNAQIRELHATLHEDRHEPRIEIAVTSCR